MAVWVRGIAVEGSPCLPTIRSLYLFFAQILRCREGSYIDAIDDEIFWDTVVDTGCGMYLHRPPLRKEGYSCTPVNTVKFAHTGLDGHHYSFLQRNGRYSHLSPVVMTCPGFWESVIVGENLREFLRLGLRTGYSTLYQLLYSSEAIDASNPFVVEHLEAEPFSETVDSEEKAFLNKLRRRFSLTPWRHVGRRLEELQSCYLPELRYREGEGAVLRDRDRRNLRRSRRC